MTLRISPKIRVKPLATRKYRPPSVMPLKTALRNTFFLPKASSSPGGQVAKISHSTAADRDQDDEGPERMAFDEFVS